MPVLRDIPVLTTGPAGTLPGLKRRGCGKKLTGHSLEKAQAMGSGAVLFEGSTAFCSHCGFEPARKPGLRINDLPEDAEDSFFLCGELIPGQLDGVTGVYPTPRGCDAGDLDAGAFDRQFRPGDRLKLPGRLFAGPQKREREAGKREPFRLPGRPDPQEDAPARSRRWMDHHRGGEKTMQEPRTGQLRLKPIRESMQRICLNSCSG